MTTNLIEKLDKCQDTLHDIRYMCFEILAELKILKRLISLSDARPSSVNGQDEERKL